MSISLIHKLLTHHHCVDSQKQILWDKVAQHPVLVQHMLLHITQICNDAHFLPEALTIRDPSLLPLALVLCTEWVVPLKPSVSENVATVVLSTSEAPNAHHKKMLEINLLAAAGGVA